MESSWKLSTPLSELTLPLLNSRVRAALEEAGLVTVQDALFRLPRRYEDRRRFDWCDNLSENRAVCLHVKVVDTGWKGYRGRGGYFEAIVRDEGGLGGSQIACRWFHFPGIAHLICVGAELIMYGKPKRYGKALCMVHPDFEDIEKKDSLNMGRIVPVYGNWANMSGRIYRNFVWELLNGLGEGVDPAYYEFSPKESRISALRLLHFPETMDDVKRARRRFALEECLIQQLKVSQLRMKSSSNGQVTASDTSLVQDLLKTLPFELTPAQRRCVREVYEDMRSPRRMNRLIQGDVGSGKTLVALCAMLLAVGNGRQAVMMAPTQILAEQHYKKFRELLDPLGITVALRTGDKSEVSYVGFGDENPSIIVGTHALLYANNAPEHPALVVIDEQHKFGVSQRERLVSQSDNPDVLVMTATPIPRTLTLTVYGDLDVSVIDALPAGRGRVVTALRSSKQMEKVVEFVRAQIDEGRQVYVVSPLIEESKSRKSSAVMNELELWQKRLPHVDIALLHGRMSAEEKEAVMRDFRANKTSMLVATTVVEVGVDVPNATIMLINNAENFGLSQLHQLRGRIGRGGHRSYCILISDIKEEDEQMEKLRILTRTSDGFELAEEDLRLRGPGDVLGTEQSGLSNVRFTEWLLDSRLIARGRELAEQILSEDPHLASPQYHPLQAMLNSPSK